MGRVLVVGSLELSVVADVVQVPRPGETATALRSRRAVGGRGVDQARAARAAGASVVMVGAVGDDDAGRWCDGALFDAGIEGRLEVVGHEPTGLAMTARDGSGASATVVIPGANGAAGRSGAGLGDLSVEDVLLVHLGIPDEVLTQAVRRAAVAEARVVLNASPFGAVAAGPAALADPFVVGERDAALLADSGVIPESLCVTFGPAGAVWNGMRIDGTDFGPRSGPPSASEVDAFCGSLAAALAEGLDQPSALRQAVSQPAG